MKGVKFLNSTFPWFTFTAELRRWLDVEKGSGIYWEDRIINNQNVLFLKKATKQEIEKYSKNNKE